MPALDGVRGLAILMVLGTHYRILLTLPSAGEFGRRVASVLVHGGYGVDLFFVLSGFLITGILLDSVASRSYFRTFYMRRILRIFPLYFGYLFLVFVILRTALRATYGEDRWASVNVWWYVTYLSNWQPNRGAEEYLLTHLWSLAVEEQFYLVWPLVVFFASGAVLGWVCAATVAGALALRLAMPSWGYDLEDLHRLTPARMDTLALGALLALALRHDRWRGACSRLKWPAAALAAAGLAFLPAEAWPTIGWTLVAVLSACLVCWGTTADRGLMAKAFRSPAMRALGKYSYGIYVLHFLPLMIASPWHLEYHLPSLPTWMAWSIRAAYIPWLIACSFGLAWISWRLLEFPFLKLKDRFTYHDGPAAAPAAPPLLAIEGDRA